MERRFTLAVVAVLLAIVGLLPVVTMIAKSLFIQGSFSLNAYGAMIASSGQQAMLMEHSLLLSTLVALLASVVGVPLGLLLGKTDLPFRHSFAVLFTVPLTMPPYVIAVAWFAILGNGGWIDRISETGISHSRSAGFFGLYGCTGVLFTVFMPIVMLLTIAYLRALNPKYEYAGLLVGGWFNVLRRITLPLIAPAILFATVLVFLLTFGEVGVPMFLRYPVYPAETLTQFAAFYDFGAATAAAVPMLAVTATILALEHRFLHRRLMALSAATPATEYMQRALGPWRFPLLGFVSVFAFATVVMPLAALILQAASPRTFLDAFLRAGDSIVRSLVFAAIGASLLTILGFFCGYLIQQRTFALWRSVDAMALFLFTLPGTVIGIGLISLWNTPLTNLVYATPAIIVLGYLAQYTVLPARMTAAMLEAIPRSLEQAARLSGASWFMTLRYIVVPLAKRGLIAGWLIGYVFCLRDLGISIVVYPPGSDTLPVRILTLMANGAPSLIAALCVILVGVTLLPLGALGIFLRHGTPQS